MSEVRVESDAQIYYWRPVGKVPLVQVIDVEDRVSSETMEQQGFIRWFRLKYPGVLIFAIPNGGWRAVTTAKQLKAEGVVPGVPDLFIPSWRLWLEFKRRKGGVVSKDQERVFTHLRRVGYAVLVCRGAEDGSRQVLKFIADGRDKNWKTRMEEKLVKYEEKHEMSGKLVGTVCRRMVDEVYEDMRE